MLLHTTGTKFTQFVFHAEYNDKSFVQDRLQANRKGLINLFFNL